MIYNLWIYYMNQPPPAPQVQPAQPIQFPPQLVLAYDENNAAKKIQKFVRSSKKKGGRKRRKTRKRKRRRKRKTRRKKKRKRRRTRKKRGGNEKAKEYWKKPTTQRWKENPLILTRTGQKLNWMYRTLKDGIPI